MQVKTHQYINIAISFTVFYFLLYFYSHHQINQAANHYGNTRATNLPTALTAVLNVKQYGTACKF